MQSNISFKQSVSKHFDYLANDLDVWSDRNRYYYRDLERFHQFLIPTHSKVLEIGCGTGSLLASVAPSVGVGIDFSKPVIEIAQSKYPHLHFYCLDAEEFTPQDLSLDSKTFDYIIISGVLGYLSNIQAVLQKIKPFCTEKTRLIFTFHNFLWEPFLHLGEKIGQRRPQPQQNWLSMADVHNLLSITGYCAVKSGRRLLMPKYLPGVSFLCNRYLSQVPGINHLCLTNYIVARLHQSQTISTQEKYSCSVIIPARNEAGNIANAIARLPHLGKETEVIFIEGHSQDNTWQEIQSLIKNYTGNFKLKAFQQTGKGKADAVRLGFHHATGDILMILDADLTVPPEDLPYFFEVIASGSGEFVNGSRLVYPRSAEAMPWLNTLANKFFASVFSFLLGQKLKDTLCGTKVLWRKDYERIAAGRSYFGDFDPFGDFDLLFGAAKLNLHIVEVPVRYQPRSYGESNIAHVKEGLILLKMCAYASRKLKFI